MIGDKFMIPLNPNVLYQIDVRRTNRPKLGVGIEQHPLLPEFHRDRVRFAVLPLWLYNRM
jgi:hypothetical protein